MANWWDSDPVASSGPDYGSAIASIESGGRYDLLGPTTKTGDRAHGKYQVMGANIPEWTEAALGKRLTAQEFLASPDAQEAVFKHRFGQYVDKYGPEGAAKAWFAGEKGMKNPNARDQLGTSVDEYGKRFTKALGYAPEAQASNMGAGNWWDADPVAEPDPQAEPTFADRFKGDESNPGLRQQEPSMVPAAIRDIPTEIVSEAKAGLEPITALSRRGEMGVVEGLMSVPNAVGGALRIAASPVTGTLKSALGHPIAAAETAVGGLINPEVAREREASGAAYEDAKRSVETALAAGRPAKMGAPVPPPALTEGQEVALAAQRQGIDLPRAVTSDSRSVQQVGKIAANVPVAGQPLRKASQTALDQMGEAMNTARAGFGSSDAATAGQVVREGVTEAIKAGPIKQKVDALYTNVDNLVNPTTIAPLPNTRAIAAQIEGRRTNAALPQKGMHHGPPTQKVTELEEALSRPGMNYEGIKDLRSYFGEMLDGNVEIPQGMRNTEVKQIYGALSKDMRLVIARAGGPDGLKAYEAAEKAAKRWADVRQDLQRVLNVNSEEGIFSKMVQAAGSKSSADLKLLGRVRGAVGPDKWNEVASALVERLGRAPDGTFSPDRLLGPSGLGGLSPEGKRLLFRSTGQTSHADAIDDIATISKRFKQLNQYANPSGTGQTTLGGAFGAGLVADPVSAVTTFLGAGGLSLVLSRPASARAMAAWAQSYQRATTAQTAANVQGYQKASKLFATAVADNIGKQIGGVDVGSLTRQLQGAVPAGAQDEQN